MLWSLFLYFIDTNAMEQYGCVEGVFHASVGRYTLNFHDAQRQFVHCSGQP